MGRPTYEYWRGNKGAYEEKLYGIPREDPPFIKTEKEEEMSRNHGFSEDQIKKIARDIAIKRMFLGLIYVIWLFTLYALPIVFFCKIALLLGMLSGGIPFVVTITIIFETIATFVYWELHEDARDEAILRLKKEAQKGDISQIEEK